MIQTSGDLPIAPAGAGQSVGDDSGLRGAIRARYGKGMRFLAKRLCPGHADACVEEAMIACAEILRDGQTAERDIPSLIRATLRRVAAGFPVLPAAELRGDDPRLECGVLEDLKERLTIFTPLQLQALARYFAGGETADAICSDLGMDAEQFTFIRKAARCATRLSLAELSETSRKLPGIAWTISGNGYELQSETA